MICNHYILITSSRYNRESPTIISVEFIDWLIQDVEFFCFEGGRGIFPFMFFSSVALAGPSFYSGLVLLFLGGLHS